VWLAVCTSVRGAISEAAGALGLGHDDIRGAVRGLSFDATCSLVVLGRQVRSY
jgi:ribulose kinase